ncbi:hypothetical protein PAPHI01_0295 [Pancytospora philotis]|nr:hypothetical protein PAPHI01_0295 [Pancytospora philotis]
MNLQNISWDISTLDCEECFENISLLDKKPFLQDEDDASDECVVHRSYENPFADHPKAPQKQREIVFVSKAQNTNTQTWLGRLQQSVPVRTLVRSAPQPQSGATNPLRCGEYCSLPTIGPGRSDAILRISPETAASLLTAQIKRDCLFVDARFGYEYRGGHIRGAVSMEDGGAVEELLGSAKTLIFYCEYSSIRGPTLARRLRNADRRTNEYPKLSCPEVYVLEGGYSRFYKEYPLLCDPEGYVRMHDKRYVKECAEACRRKRLRKN